MMVEPALCSVICAIISMNIAHTHTREDTNELTVVKGNIIGIVQFCKRFGASLVVDPVRKDIGFHTINEHPVGSSRSGYSQIGDPADCYRGIPYPQAGIVGIQKLFNNC